MFTLRLLGGLSIQCPSGLLVSGPAAQRHRLALLAYLALRGPQQASRDTLIGLLWPERDDRAGRRLLNLAVHTLRRALGREAIRSVADGLALDPAGITTDVAQFEGALAARDWSRAALLYRGPLLDGFHLPAAPEFDRWAADARTQVAGRYAAILENLAKERECSGDWRGAVEWWQRLALTDRGNGAVVRRLMLAQEAMRDRAGALEEARRHTRFMAEEFGAGPDPLVAALAQSLASGASTRSARPAERSDLRPLAVLTFTSVGFGEDHGGFGEGIAFELRRQLATAGIRLVSPSGLSRQDGLGLSAREIGGALGVAGVIEGTVRRVGERIRVTAHLVETNHGFHLWSGAFERRAGDPFRLQEEFGAEIAAGVEAEWDRSPEKGWELDSRGLILRGRFALGRRTCESLRTAVRYFSAALSQDPAGPGGFSGLADAYAVMGFYDCAPPAEAFGSARRAARRALGLDARLAAPRATLAYVDLYHRWNFPLAEARFRRAIAVDPRLALAHQWYGNLLAAAGRREDSVREMARAVSLDPQSLVAGAALGWTLYFAGRSEEAVEQCGATLELDPSFGLAHLWQGLALQELNRWDEALAALGRAGPLLEGSQATAALARATAAAGDGATAMALLDQVENASGYIPSYEIAKVHLALGRPEVALDWLDRAASERAHSMVFLRVDPQLVTLRDCPRFQALVGQVAM